MVESDKSVSLYGASGHAKVVMDIVEASGLHVCDVFDDNVANTHFLGIEVKHVYDGASPMIVTIGDCNIRRRIVERLNCHFLSAIHPTAIISPSVKIGVGTVVMQGVVIQADATIGNHCIVNTQSSVGHDCRIGDFVHIASGATVCGGTEIGEGTWLGAGSVVKQGIKIGKNCMIGAGSVVVRDIPDGVTAFGNPARVKVIEDNMYSAGNQLITGGGKALVFNSLAA